MLDYRARYETEWRDLSDRHKNLRIRAEENLMQFITGKSVPNVAIAGPYGMGKSQLLLHLMKVVLQNGGLAIYSHAATLLGLVEQDMDSTDFSNKIKQAVKDEVGALNTGVKGPLEIDENLADVIRQQFPEGIDTSKIVLLIDEWEQVYQELQNKIKTDDRNPLRALLDDSSLHLVLAFAPKSVYEFGTGSSLGGSEADRRRVTVFRIPPIDPKEFSEYLALSKGKANFFWWIGRGRMGLVLKAYQDSQNFDLDSAEGLRSFVRVSMGEISGVPALELERLFQKANWKEIFNLCPKTTAKSARCSFQIDDKFELNAQRFFMKLGFSAEHAISLAGYMKLLLRGISANDDVSFLNSMDDFPALVEATRDLALEFEEEPDMIHALQEKYEGIGDLSSLATHAFFDPAGHLGEIKEFEVGMPFTLKETLALFPFPLSVPTLPGITENDVRSWLDGVKDVPLAKDRVDGTFFLIFNSFNAFDKYLKLHEHSFLERALPENHHTTVLLLEGPVGEPAGAALWLKGQGRLDIKLLMPRLLADFTRNACYIVNKNTGQALPVEELRQRLALIREDFAKKGDRASARKTLHYMNAIEEVFRLLTQTHKSTCTYADERRATLLAELRKQKEIPVALPYPFIIAFAEEDINGMELLSETRDLFGRDGVLQRFLPEAGGYRSAVDFLPSRRRGQPVQLSEQVQRVKGFYGQSVHALGVLTEAVSDDNFLYLSDDDLTRFLLRTLYESKRRIQVPADFFDQVKAVLQRSLDCRTEIKKYEDQIKEVTGLEFDADLNFSDEESTGIQKLMAITEKARETHIEYQYVFQQFIKEVLAKVIEASGVYEKKVRTITFETAWNDLLGVTGFVSSGNTVTSQAVEYLGLTRDRLALITQVVKDAQEAAAGLDSVSIDNIHTLRENFGEVLALRDALRDIERNTKEIQQSIASFGGQRR